MTPAINIDERSYGPWTGRFYYGTYSWPMSDSSLGYVRWQTRPASGNSPKRGDGTRAPRAWDHSWGVWQPPVGVFEYEADYLFKWASLPAYPVQLLTNLRAFDAGWAGDGDPFPVSVQNAARTKLLLKLLQADPTVKDSSAFSFGETLGEARETVSFCREGLESILNWIRATAREIGVEGRILAHWLITGKHDVEALKRHSRRRGRGVAAAIRAIPAAWLAFQFGLKPLLSDMQAAAQAVEFLKDEIPMSFTVKAGHQDLVVRYGSFRSIHSPGWRTVETVTVESRVHLSVRYDVVNVGRRTLAQLGLNNPLATLYAVSPWSWAIDYCLGISDWLTALFADSGTQFIEGAESFIMKVEGADTQVGVNAEVNLIRYPRQNSTISVGRFQRVVLTGTPVPSAPVWKPRLGLTRIANLASALSQLVR